MPCSIARWSWKNSATPCWCSKVRATAAMTAAASYSYPERPAERFNRPTEGKESLPHPSSCSKPVISKLRYKFPLRLQVVGSWCLAAALWLFRPTHWTLVGGCIFVTISGQFTVLTLSKANLQTEAMCPTGPPTPDLAGLEACGRSIFVTGSDRKQLER